MGTRALSVSVEAIGSRPCGETPAHHSLVQAAMTATRLVGRHPDLALASTDANVPISQGIPAIAIGAGERGVDFAQAVVLAESVFGAGGRGGDAHTHSEWFDNSNGTVGVARALTIVMAAAGVA